MERKSIVSHRREYEDMVYEGQGGKTMDEMEKAYHEVLMELNRYKLSDKCQIVELQSELKLKKFELSRLSLLYSEADGKYKDVLLEKEKLAEKYENLKDDFGNSKAIQNERIASLTLQLQEKSIRLETYDKLEAALDSVVLQAAAMPNEHDATELLAAYEYGSSIPSSTKRRLEQSLKLARRVLELEGVIAEQKKELFVTRDKSLIFKQEFESIQASLKLSNVPMSQLIQIIQKRDLKIMKLNENIEELKKNLNEVTLSNEELQTKLSQVEAKLVEETTSKPVSIIYRRSSAVTPHSANSSSQQQNSSITSTTSSSGKRVAFRTVGIMKKDPSSLQGILKKPAVKYSKISADSLSSSSSSNGGSFVHIQKPLTFSKLRYDDEE